MEEKVGGSSKTFSVTGSRPRHRPAFPSKSRCNAQSGIEDAVYASLRETQEESDFRILEIGVDLGGRLHLLITFKPALSIEQVVRSLKMPSTHKLWALEPTAPGGHYWGSKKRLWSGGYFASTVG